MRFRDPEDFDTIRTPGWADHAADSVRQGAKVRTGTPTGSDNWHTESVLLPKPIDPETARREARQIVDKIGE